MMVTVNLVKIHCKHIKLTRHPPVVHTCNPSYSGGRDQEDRNSKPTLANSS
jgi:hypothetical protein